MNQNIKKIRELIRVVILISAIAGFASCEKYTFTPPKIDPTIEWSLATDIQPIFTTSCISCHGGVISPDLRTDKSFTALTAGSFVNAPAESSKLYTTMTAASHDARSSSEEKQKVLNWIKQGAKNN
jgi:mono/diheme cytochrome c family protein